MYFHNTNSSATPSENHKYSAGKVLGLSANRDIAPTTSSIEIQATGNKNVIINAPLIVNDLTVNGFIDAKSCISIRVTTSGGTPSTINAGSFVLGTPGAIGLRSPSEPGGTCQEAV